LQSEVIAQRDVRTDTESLVRKMQHDINDLARYIQDPRALKEQVGAWESCSSAAAA